MPLGYVDVKESGQQLHFGPHLGAFMVVSASLWERSIDHQKALESCPVDSLDLDYYRGEVSDVSGALDAFDNQNLLEVVSEVKSATFLLPPMLRECGWLAVDIGVQTEGAPGWTFYARYAFIADGNCLRVKVMSA